MLPRVLDAQLDSAKVIQVKLPVFHVARVNSMTLLMRRHANLVKHRLSLVAKKETPVAQLAPQVGRPRKAVPNAPRAGRVRLVTGAKIVQWVLLEKVLTQMPHNANNVIWVKPQRSQGQLLAASVMWVRTVVPTVNVRHVLPANTKMAKVKQVVKNVTSIRI